MARGPKKPDFEDAIRISDLFTTLSEEGKNMALAYLSALRDKELADRANVGMTG